MMAHPTMAVGLGLLFSNVPSFGGLQLMDAA
jgi:hypothetical protein